MRSLKIGPIVVSDDSPAFTIAEAGHNHGGDLETAIRLLNTAADAGFSSFKLQKRSSRDLFVRSVYEQPYNSENSYGKTYGEHREFLEFGEAEYQALKAHAERRGMLLFSTAFDVPSGEFLARLGVPAIKVASGDIINTPLLDSLASLRIPLIVSTGTASLPDVERAAEIIARHHDSFALLQCTAAYPCPADMLHLRVIQVYRERFPDTVIGFSTHYNGPQAASWAYLLGARVIEQHVTLDRAAKGSDHAFSLEPVGQRKFIRDLERARLALGDGVKRRLPCEAGAVAKMGKSLYAARPLAAGTVLAPDDIAIKTPGGFVPPYELPRYLGATLASDLVEDEPLPPLEAA